MKETSNPSVDTTLEQLVTHFHQNVHTATLTEEENVRPYFDADNGDKSPELPPTVRYWLAEVLSPSPSLHEIIAWIQGYESSLRPLLHSFLSESASLSSPTRSTPAGYIPALQNYEIILSQWLGSVSPLSSSSSEPATPSISVSSEETIDRTIQLLSTDITLLTSERYSPTLSPYSRCNIVLPTLLRIFEKVLEVLWLILQGRHGMEDSSRSTSFSQTRIASLRRCAITLLAFDPECKCISPCDVAASLLDPFKHNIETLCCFPPHGDGSTVSEEDIQILNQDISLCDVDWETCAQSTAVWSDASTGVATRSAQSVWKMLVAVLTRQVQCEEKVFGGLEGTKFNVDSTLVFVVRQLGGIKLFFKDIRAHFFARDMFAWQPAVHTSQQVVLGRRVTKSQPVVTEPPFRLISSRIVAALRGLKILALQDVKELELSSSSSWNDTFEELFPIVASLVDSTRTSEIALGASGLLCIMDSFADSTVTLRQCGEGGRNFVENVLSVLELSFRTSGEGPAAVAVGQVQSRIYGLLQEQGGPWEYEFRNRRRRTTQQWLSSVSRFSHQDNTRCWELLVGGAIPLLLQHARNESAAEGIEFCRLGLSALLPLLDRDYCSANKTQTAAMIALINMMFAAYPIMENHGGKILTSVLGAASTFENDSPQHQFAVFTGAISLVICGPKFTEEIIKSIEDDHNSFHERLITSITKIKALAHKLRQQFLAPG